METENKITFIIDILKIYVLENFLFLISQINTFSYISLHKYLYKNIIYYYVKIKNLINKYVTFIQIIITYMTYQWSHKI